MNKAIEISNKFDEFGKLKIEPIIDIQKGDKVHYLEVEIFKNKKKFIHHYGIWDGKKVELDGSGNIIIRTTRWLTKL